jgi:hypothetical protein
MGHPAPGRRLRSGVSGSGERCRVQARRLFRRAGRKAGMELTLAAHERRESLRHENGEAGLERRSHPAYSPTMDTAADKTPPGWLVDSLERSEAQIATGQSVPLEPILDRLRTSIARSCNVHNSRLRGRHEF